MYNLLPAKDLNKLISRAVFFGLFVVSSYFLFSSVRFDKSKKSLINLNNVKHFHVNAFSVDLVSRHFGLCRAFLPSHRITWSRKICLRMLLIIIINCDGIESKCVCTKNIIFIERSC